jgi:hypothetical protein
VLGAAVLGVEEGDAVEEHVVGSNIFVQGISIFY